MPIQSRQKAERSRFSARSGHLGIKSGIFSGARAMLSKAFRAVKPRSYAARNPEFHHSPRSDFLGQTIESGGWESHPFAGVIKALDCLDRERNSPPRFSPGWRLTASVHPGPSSRMASMSICSPGLIPDPQVVHLITEEIIHRHTQGLGNLRSIANGRLTFLPRPNPRPGTARYPPVRQARTETSPSLSDVV